MFLVSALYLRVLCAMFAHYVEVGSSWAISVILKVGDSAPLWALVAFKGGDRRSKEILGLLSRV